MSIAWGSLVLLIVLLPGVLFFVGTYLPDQFTREAEARSPLGHLAGALLITFFVHGLAYSTLTGLCGDIVPCIDLGLLLDTVSIDPNVSGSTKLVSRKIAKYRWSIFSYVLATSAGGVLLGALYGMVVSKGKFRGLSRHPWVYDLSVDGLTYAYILTHVRHEERVLMYKGFLRAFGLQADGRFSYIVLTDVTRMYMTLGEHGSETSGTGGQKVIGASTSGQVVLPTEPTMPRKRRHSAFVIEGEDIANAVFDVLETPAKPIHWDALRTMVTEEAGKIGYELTVEALKRISRLP